MVFHLDLYSRDFIGWPVKISKGAIGSSWHTNNFQTSVLKLFLKCFLFDFASGA